MSHLVTITGATGHIGGAIAERLLKAGHKVRAVGRSSDKLAPLTAKGAEARVGDQADTGFLTEAFTGADAVFAMIPPNPAAPDLRAEQRNFATAIKEAVEAADVKRVVALSSLGAEHSSGTGPIAGLHEFETILKAVPNLGIVALRPTYFMENFLYSIPMIKNAGFNGGFVLAATTIPMIATRDIAVVAAEYLAEPVFEGMTVRELLGPKDHTFAEATWILGTAIGKPDLAYVDLSKEDYKNGLLDAGFSESAADTYIEMEKAFNDGLVKRTSERNAENTTPTTLEEFARDTFAPAYKGSAAGA